MAAALMAQLQQQQMYQHMPAPAHMQPGRQQIAGSGGGAAAAEAAGPSQDNWSQGDGSSSDTPGGAEHRS